MARVECAVNAHEKRRTTLKCAFGHRGQRPCLYREVKEWVTRSFVYNYRDRKARRDDLRKLWIAHINTACHAEGMTYNRSIQDLCLAEVEVDRRMLTELAVSDITAFDALVKVVKDALPKDVNRPAAWATERITRNTLGRRKTLGNPSSIKVRRIAGLSRRSARLKSSLVRIKDTQTSREALWFAPDLVEDVYLTEAAGASEPELLSLVGVASVHGHRVSERVVRVVAEVAQDRLAMASLAVFPLLHELQGRVALILPEIQDPGSTGAMLRLAGVCGTSSAFMGEQSIDVSPSKVIRTSVESMLHVLTPCFPDLTQLVLTPHESQWLITDTALDAPLTWGFEMVSQLVDKKVTWMMGNEAHGLDTAQRELCDVLMAVPMFGQAESLSVSQATTLAL